MFRAFSIKYVCLKVFKNQKKYLYLKIKIDIKGTGCSTLETVVLKCWNCKLCTITDWMNRSTESLMTSTVTCWSHWCSAGRKRDLVTWMKATRSLISLLKVFTNKQWKSQKLRKDVTGTFWNISTYDLCFLALCTQILITSISALGKFHILTLN